MVMFVLLYFRVFVRKWSLWSFISIKCTILGILAVYCMHYSASWIQDVDKIPNNTIENCEFIQNNVKTSTENAQNAIMISSLCLWCYYRPETDKKIPTTLDQISKFGPPTHFSVCVKVKISIEYVNIYLAKYCHSERQLSDVNYLRFCLKWKVQRWCNVG